MLQLHGGFRVRVKVSVRVLFRQTLDEWMGPKVHLFPFTAYLFLCNTEKDLSLKWSKSQSFKIVRAL